MPPMTEHMEHMKHMLGRKLLAIRDFGYWKLCHIYNVIILRRRVIIITTIASVIFVVICCEVMRPVYAATCHIKVDRDCDSFEIPSSGSVY